MVVFHLETSQDEGLAKNSLLLDFLHQLVYQLFESLEKFFYKVVNKLSPKSCLNIRPVFQYRDLSRPENLFCFQYGFYQVFSGSVYSAVFHLLH